MEITEQYQQEASFSANGQLEWVKDANGNQTTYDYDGFGRAAKAVFPEGNPNLPVTLPRFIGAPDKVLLMDQGGKDDEARGDEEAPAVSGGIQGRGGAPCGDERAAA